MEYVADIPRESCLTKRLEAQHVNIQTWAYRMSLDLYWHLTILLYQVPYMRYMRLDVLRDAVGFKEKPRSVSR